MLAAGRAAWEASTGAEQWSLPPSARGRALALPGAARAICEAVMVLLLTVERWP